MSHVLRISMKIPRQRVGLPTGITLAELVVSMSVMVIVAGAVITTLAPSGVQNLDAVARKVASDLRLARNQAILDNSEWTVLFDSRGHAYTLAHTGTGVPSALPRPLDGSGATYRVEIPHVGVGSAESNGVKLSGVVLKTSKQVVSSISFDSKGGTGAVRTEDVEVWLTHGVGKETRYVRLTVSWLTGQTWVDRPIGVASEAS